MLCSGFSVHLGLMTETNESQENQNEEEAAVPTMTTVERAEMLLQQDAAIRAKINGGAALDEAVDPSNKEFGPLAHPEQVQMRVAKRAMMLKEGIQPYPVTLDVTATIEEVRAKYDGKLEAGDETEDVVGIAGRVLFLRNAGGLCFVQLSAGDGTKIQGMISKKEIGADSLKQFKQLVDLGDHLFIKGRVIASKTGELSVFATEWAIAAKALQPLPAQGAQRGHPHPQAVHRHDRGREDPQHGAQPFQGRRLPAQDLRRP